LDRCRGPRLTQGIEQAETVAKVPQTNRHAAGAVLDPAIDKTIDCRGGNGVSHRRSLPRLVYFERARKGFWSGQRHTLDPWMHSADWLASRPTYKREVIASEAVVASNHPLGSTAGAEVLASGGNAVDAAVATLFALSVVEPMMVSPFGAGFFLIRDGRSGDMVFIDNYATVPAAATPTMFDAVPGSLDYETVGQANSVGYRAVGT